MFFILSFKTFFIAAIMSMRYNRIAVLLGALLALLAMTIISTAFGTILTRVILNLLGTIVPVLLPAHITHIIITVLFFFFGAKLLYDVYADKPVSQGFLYRTYNIRMSMMNKLKSNKSSIRLMQSS